MKRIFIKLISTYQKTLSPDHGWFKGNHTGGYCKYTPSCSQYCKESIEKYGVVKGVLRGTYRIFRCNPWSNGGYDPS